MGKLNVFCIAILILLFTSSVIAQKPEEGLYVSVSNKGGIANTYSILQISKEVATLEVFTKWGGSWIPALGSWDKNYEPQYLMLNEKDEFINLRVKLFLKKGTLKGIAKKTFVGQINFKFKKVDKIPDKFNIAKKEGLKLTGKKVYLNN